MGREIMRQRQRGLHAYVIYAHRGREVVMSEGQRKALGVPNYCCSLCSFENWLFAVY